MHAAGFKAKYICEELGIKPGTLSAWVKREKRPKSQRKYLVSHYREVLEDLDSGMTVNEVQRQTRLNKETIRRWRDDPRYREATFEYNDEFDYDAEDATDRSVVAQYLCNTTLDLVERLEYMFASAGVTTEVQDDNSTDHKPRYYTKGNRGRQA
jgi:uncharacterized protein YueI